MDAKEYLLAFIEAFKKEGITFEELKKFLTLTQQEECRYPNKISVEGTLMGLYSFIHRSSEIEIKEKYSHNEVLKDFVISFNIPALLGRPITMQCRVIKESSIRKPHPEGHWGINISSFKKV